MGGNETNKIEMQVETVARHVLLKRRKEKILREPVILEGEITFIKKATWKFVGLRERVVESRLKRVRLGQREEKRWYREKKGEIGRGARLIRQLATGVAREKSAPVCKTPPPGVKEPLVAAAEWDNRHYLHVSLGGRVYRALFDPGATCSLIGPGLTERFAEHIVPSKSRIRAFDGSKSGVSGVLPVTLEIDGCEKVMRFRAVKSIGQEILLGTDFCIAFRFSVDHEDDLWRANRSEHWYKFADVTNRPEASRVIAGRLAQPTEVEGEEEETTIEGVRDWVCCLSEEKGEGKEENTGMNGEDERSKCVRRMLCELFLLNIN